MGYETFTFITANFAKKFKVYQDMNRRIELYGEKSNVVNNIRLLYIHLHDGGQVINVKDFAMKIGVGKSTAEGWLREGYAPLPDFRRKIETTFGLTEGSLTDEVHPKIQNWDEEYFKRNGAKPSLRVHRYEVPEGKPMMVAEDNADVISRILSFTLEERKEMLMEIRHELQEHIGKSQLKDCPRLLEIGFGY